MSHKLDEFYLDMMVSMRGMILVLRFLKLLIVGFIIVHFVSCGLVFFKCLLKHMPKREELTDSLWTFLPCAFRVRIALLCRWWLCGTYHQADPSANSWVHAEGADEMTVWAQYLFSCYWAITTMTTVGASRHCQPFYDHTKYCQTAITTFLSPRLW